MGNRSSRPVKKAAAETEAELADGMVRVDLPAEPTGCAACRRNINGQLKRPQAEALAAVRQACARRGLRLESGRPVETSLDALRYLLERIYRQL